MIHTRTSGKVSLAWSPRRWCDGLIGSGMSSGARQEPTKPRQKELFANARQHGLLICPAPPCTFHPGPRSSFDGLRTSCAGLLLRQDTSMRLFWRTGWLRPGLASRLAESWPPLLPPRASGFINLRRRRHLTLDETAQAGGGSQLRRRRMQQHLFRTCIRHVFGGGGNWADAPSQLPPPTSAGSPHPIHPRRHTATWAWLTGPSVCFPFRDEVHFLCSLCFRSPDEEKKRKEISLLKCCVYIVWVLWGKAQSRHTVGGL